MTLWHLLLGIAFTSPLFVALAVGMQTGRASGVVMAFLLGMALSIAGVCGLNTLGYEAYRRTQKVASEAAQNILVTLMCFGALAWIFLTGILTKYVTETVCRFITS